MNVDFLGIQPKTTSGEQVVAALGGLVCILATCGFSFWIVGVAGSLAVVASMGAVTVLLFAVPHGPLSQPWALFMGNGVSAVAGVSCAQLISDPVFASGLAVGLATAAMHLLRCTHPPGGATALSAVIGGPEILDLGYFFVLAPVLLNCTIILIVALLFNNIFGWRRYPAAVMRYKPIQRPDTTTFYLTQDHIERGMQEVGGVIDVSSVQLQQIFEAAMTARSKDFSHRTQLELGGVYSNNRPGANWAIRKIIDYATHPDSKKALIIYKVIDGAQKNTTGSCNREEFAEWAVQRLKPVAKSG